jgi:hypothetical protein
VGVGFPVTFVMREFGVVIAAEGPSGCIYPINKKNTTNNSNVTIERKIISFQELIILYRLNDYPKFYLQRYKSFITVCVLNLYI